MQRRAARIAICSLTTVALSLTACGRSDVTSADTDFGTDSIGTESESETIGVTESETTVDPTDTSTTSDPDPFCGNSVLEEEEACDFGDINGTDGSLCTDFCELDYCGNDHRGPNEECDFGEINGEPFSDCNEFCQFNFCGDGSVGPFEECDEGFNNGNPFGFCTSACTVNFCGDGFLGNGEDCDLGSANGSNSQCTVNCTDAFCGDGLLGPGEACDDGNFNNNDGCTNQCRFPGCGDGFVQFPEECDDGNFDDTDFCSNNCLDARCGDGILQSVTGEQCDDGNMIDTDMCTSQCRPAACGDSIVQPSNGEQCDDGNQNNNDLCDNNCQDVKQPMCGDGTQDAGEECDDGNMVDDDGCTNACTLPECGDGILQSGEGEQCDDGNAQNGDGCNDDCRPSAQALFTEIWDGVGGGDQAFDVAVDTSGNAYVAGRTRVDVPMIHNELWLRKYSPSGQVLWTETFWAGEGNDYGYGVAVDPSGDVIVGGRVSRIAGGGNVLVRKYTSAGSLVWSDEWASPAGSTDKVNDVVTDGSGNVYVAGDTWNTGQSSNVFVRKYNGAGAVQWTRTYDGSGSEDVGHGIAVDLAGRILVVGESWAAGTGANHWLRRYDANGGTLGTLVYDGDDSEDVLYGVKATPDGGHVVVGTVWVPSAGQNHWIRKYSAADVLQWTRAYNGPASSEDVLQDVAVAADGSLTVVGWHYVGSARDGWIRKYSATGALMWTRTVAGSAGLNDYLYGAECDPSGNIWVVGEVRDATTDRDIFVRKYSP